MSVARPFIGIKDGKGPIKLMGPIIELLPTEIHLKEDGDVDGNPSVAIVMSNEVAKIVVGQLSLKMWNEGLKDIGYKIVKL